MDYPLAFKPCFFWYMDSHFQPPETDMNILKTHEMIFLNYYFN